MKKFLFSKKYRILKIYISSNILHNYNQIIINYFNIYYRQNKFFNPRIGIVINKKHEKLSFKRNLIKRIIRESFRLNKFKLNKLDFLIISNSKFNIFNKDLLFNDLNELWNLNKFI